MNGPPRAASTALLLAALILTPAAGEEPPEPPSLLGPVTREQIEDAEPTWVAVEAESELDVEAAQALAAVEPGGDVTVYFGTWCSDSQREPPSRPSCELRRVENRYPTGHPGGAQVTESTGLGSRNRSK